MLETEQGQDTVSYELIDDYMVHEGDIILLDDGLLQIEVLDFKILPGNGAARRQADGSRPLAGNADAAGQFESFRHIAEMFVSCRTAARIENGFLQILTRFFHIPELVMRPAQTIQKAAVDRLNRHRLFDQL